MANRHLSRSIVLQSLFEWDFLGKKGDLKSVIDKNTQEFAPGHSDAPFMYELAETVERKQQVIDDIIVKAAPDWPLEKISNVDRSVLRMGLAELLFGDRDQVPPKVAINEAIELAKTFGGENSGKFVNGVLGAVYKEIGEPGKEQVTKSKSPKNKEPEEPIDISKLPVEAKAGGIIFTKHEGKVLVALVHDVFGYWTLVKSGVEEGEKYEETAVRSVREKMGLSATVVEEIGKIEYVASHPEKKKLLKVVAYFLMEAPYKEIVLKSNGGLDKAQWMEPGELVDLTIYDDILPSIAKAIEIINNK
ncbi:transcription antitermination factor NusB [Candidatus Nomurabacteria bacterium]|nr:transcription antitermination factor NusB [Candidatus Nomurabacteria bacterium]